MYNTKYDMWLIYCSRTCLRCDKCGEKLLLFHDYDADFCPNCNIWVTPNCCDTLCPFCAHRPDTPAHALANYDLLLDYSRHVHYNQKEKAMRRFVFNKKYRK